MLLDQSILSVERDSVEIEVEGLAPLQAKLSGGIKPEAHELRVARGVDPATVLGEKGAFGNAVEARKEGQSIIEDLAHDVAVASIAEEFQGKERPHGMGRRDHCRAWKACLVEDLIQTDLTEVGQKKKESSEFGFELSGGEVQMTYICNWSDLGPCAREPFLIVSPGQACKPFFLKNHGNCRRTQFMSYLTQDQTDVINGEVLLSQSDDLVPKLVCFGSSLGTFGRRNKEVSLGVLAKLVT